MLRRNTGEVSAHYICDYGRYLGPVSLQASINLLEIGRPVAIILKVVVELFPQVAMNAFTRCLLTSTTTATAAAAAILMVKFVRDVR